MKKLFDYLNPFKSPTAAEAARAELATISKQLEENQQMHLMYQQAADWYWAQYSLALRRRTRLQAFLGETQNGH